MPDSGLSNTNNALKADLIDHTIFIDPKAANIGGAWQGRNKRGEPCVWEPEAVKFFLGRCNTPNPFIIDIGANTGLYCLLPAINPAITGFAFEPNPEAYALLKSNLALNGLANSIRTFPLALSDKAGSVTLKIPASGKDSGLACLGDPKRFTQWREVTVPTDTLDNILSYKKITHVNLIKIDTEGCELFVLKGAENCIREFKPEILLEFDERNTSQFGYHPNALRELLESWGYHFTMLGKDNAFFSARNKKRAAPYPTRQKTDPFYVFFSDNACAINDARLTHLDSLNLPLEGKNVLEVGAGVGLLTYFFESKGCNVLSTEGRPENVAENLRLHPQRNNHVLQRDLTDPGSHDNLGAFDLVFCYGTLYHLPNPATAIQDLARVTSEILMLETCVAKLDNNQVNLQAEDTTSVNQAFSCSGCRPGRDWVLSELKKYFPYVYITATQPTHGDFPLEWPVPQDRPGNARSVFIASRKKIDSPHLLTALPHKQVTTGAALPSNEAMPPARPAIPKTDGNAGGASNEASFLNTTGQEVEAFQHWAELISFNEKRLYYRDQSIASFKSLCAQARSFKPTVIVELGTLSGMSLRAWRLAAPQAKIKAVDLSFKSLHNSLELLPIDLANVDLVESDILRVDFSRFWGADDRVLFFVDAHDLPNVPITPFVLRNALPLLPEGSLVVIDDIWHSPEAVTADNCLRLFEKHVLHELDELQLFEAHYAPYHNGGSFFGFMEVKPLLRYINKYGIDLYYEPGCKHVSFFSRKKPSEVPAFDKEAFDGQCGIQKYHPLGEAAGNPTAQKMYNALKNLYAQGDTHAALNFALDLQEKQPDIPHLYYAMAVLLLRNKNYIDAEKFLDAEANTATPHQNTRQLKADLRRRFYPMAEVKQPRKPGLTIFAAPKAFTGHAAIIQKNAIASWTKLTPRPEIILFGDDEGIAEAAAELGVRHIPKIRGNDLNTPLVNSLFLQAQEEADTELLAYVNADIVLFDSFMQGAALAAAAADNFLLVGARWDYEQTTPIDFSQANWADTLQQKVFQSGAIHPPTGMDYFIFRAGKAWPSIPPFALGRFLWDTWLLHAAIAGGLQVIDGSDFITAFHQNHDYAHHPGGIETMRKGVERARNLFLAGGYPTFTKANDATFFIDKQGAVLPKQGNRQ